MIMTKKIELKEPHIGTIKKKVETHTQISTSFKIHARIFKHHHNHWRQFADC